jgi:hypothetical protein
MTVPVAELEADEVEFELLVALLLIGEVATVDELLEVAVVSSSPHAANSRSPPQSPAINGRRTGIGRS